jgi:hypothetical protein
MRDFNRLLLPISENDLLPRVLKSAVFVVTEDVDPLRGWGFRRAAAI